MLQLRALYPFGFKVMRHQTTLSGCLLNLLLLLISPTVIAQAQTSTTPAPGIDFSYAGYGGGGTALPTVPTILTVKPTGSDDTRLLQAALNHLATLPAGKNGMRGALLLAPGRFLVQGQLHVQGSGIVLRGSKDNSTTLVATGQSRRTLLEVGSPQVATGEASIQVTDKFVPAGSRHLTLAHTNDLKVGDKITVTRPSTREWISALGMDTLKGTFADLRFHWTPGSRNLIWDRTITAINQNQVTLDAPITTALEQRYGGGTITKLTQHLPLQQIGIEHLVIESEFNKANPKDEEHAWYGILLDNVEDAWVQQVTTRHLVSSAVRVGPRARRVTVENCRNERPVSEEGGYRRQSFLVEGQQVLVQNCTADSGLNDFAIGFTAAGPNVFRNCTATNALGASGSYESWASGVLYDNVKIEGAALRLTYDANRAQAGGWTAANAIIWNCTATDIAAKGPADAPNQVVQAKGSLFQQQLQQRLGPETNLPGTSPAAPAPVREFTLKDLPASPPVATPATAPLQLINGRFVIGNKTLWGGAVNDAWWLGQTSPASALDAGISITRFVPGKTGAGLTENLPELAAKVTAQGTPFYQSGPAIWYDRRRDDHSITERPDANVWAAFYELPWARSGTGRAWDGLSRYDLTQYNPWYFERTRAFAALADQEGFVLYHHLYNNHNLLETASHWIDFPWRPENNINETGMQVPPLEPKDRIHVANQFYDADNPQLRALHRQYIFHVLDQLGEFNNIIFGLSFQYSGPASFQKFFQQTVAEWEKQHNRQVRLVLDTSKDVTDAILSAPELARQVAVIDMRYWHYLPDGSLWAPAGGRNLAFREMHPKEFGDPTTPEMVYKQVREYRAQYPNKAIVAWHAGAGAVPTLMAGGAQVLMRNPTAGHGQGRSIDRTPLDVFVQEQLATRLMHLHPTNGLLQNETQNWALADNQQETVLLYSLSGEVIELAQKLKNKHYTGTWFDPETGNTITAQLPKLLKKGTAVVKPDVKPWLLLLRK
ncbi:DUF6298 domain-containing protein [Pontibacter sp. 13R65]|uniref:DUF6298 domain-containing protein n=1 Tax=Pontibacter sp. 13R65 TaxID=3127458 RepID=UPI00301D56F9